jgi:hypothetical protein
MKYYCGLEFDAAARHANAVLTGERERTRAMAAAAFGLPAQALGGRKARGGRHGR